MRDPIVLSDSEDQDVIEQALTFLADTYWESARDEKMCAEDPSWKQDCVEKAERCEKLVKVFELNRGV